MTVAEAHRLHQATLEARRAASPHAPAVAADEHEATERCMDDELDRARRQRDAAWLEHVAR